MLIKVKFTFDCDIKLFDVFEPVYSMIVIFSGGMFVILVWSNRILTVLERLILISYV